MKITRIDIIRHGEPEGGNVFRGRTDHQLTELGSWQFLERVQRHHAQWQRVMSSPLARCLTSAQAVACAHAIPLCVDERLAEIDYGQWENQAVNSVLKNDELNAKKMWEDPLNFCAPGGESVQALQVRVIQVWNQLIEQHSGEHILVVCHGGVMRVLAQHLLMLNPSAMNRLAIPYAGMLCFRIDSSEYQGKLEHWVTLESMAGSELTHE